MKIIILLTALALPAAAFAQASPPTAEQLNAALTNCAGHVKRPPGPARATPPAAWQFEPGWESCAVVRDEYMRRFDAATEAAKKKQIDDAANALKSAR